MNLFTAVGGDGQRDDCTSGFMSLERIRALQGRGDLTSLEDANFHIIVPGMKFTCSGNISSWIFGAEWYGNNESYTELQIWRSSGDGSYTKVGSTTIMTEENTTQLYGHKDYFKEQFYKKSNSTSCPCCCRDR